MIDHGASLYFHHNWDEDVLARSRGAFPQIKDHVLLAQAGELREVDAELSAMLTPEALERIVSMIPDSWLDKPEHRGAYQEWLLRRLEEPREWVEEAIRARTLLL